MHIIHQKPWTRFDRLHGGLGPFSAASSDNTDSWIPAVDVVESEQRFDLIADLPGVGVNDIDISIERGVLRLRGERAGVTASEDDERYLRRSERRNGTFERLFSLPDNVDADNVSAHAKDGVVTISIHKKPEPVAKRVEVKLAN